MILIQRQNAASVLSLNQTEGEELLRISQAFPPPPEGELVDFCDGDTSVRCFKTSTYMDLSRFLQSISASSHIPMVRVSSVHSLNSVKA